MTTTTDVAPTTEPAAPDEVGMILPDLDMITLESGLVVAMRKLKGRETFLFLRILTKGLGSQLSELARLDEGLDLDDEQGNEVFVKKLLTMLVIALPNAFDEFAAFLRAMVQPADLIEGKLNKADKERNAAAKALVDQELAEPELGDMLSIGEAVLRREAGDLRALGKRLVAMFTMGRRTGQIR